MYELFLRLLTGKRRKHKIVDIQAYYVEGTKLLVGEGSAFTIYLDRTHKILS